MNKMSLMKHVILQIKKHPRLVALLRSTAQQVSPETVVLLDYPINPRRRWVEDNPHQCLYNIINQNRSSYKAAMQAFLPLSQYFLTIPARRTASSLPTEPCWINSWIPALDGVALYGHIVIHKPQIYMEVGSGNSTMFARKAIADHNLGTRIVSIDPCPRAEVAEICDEAIRKPVEEVDLQVFDRLEKNDILLIDNSHRVFMNSDATTMFLDVIPRLKPGVLVAIHDITLPYDYPTEWVNRFYSEQYLLAAYILAKGHLFDIVFPGMFISRDKELRSILAPLWEKEEMKNINTHGNLFWIRMR